MVILDTNIIIDHLRTREKESSLVLLLKTRSKDEFAISILTIQELYEGKSTRNENLEQKLLATISPLKILPYTFDVAQLAGQIARDEKPSIELADAAIAATAIINGSLLFTLNKKDFRGIKNLELFSFKI